MASGTYRDILGASCGFDCAADPELTCTDVAWTEYIWLSLQMGVGGGVSTADIRMQTRCKIRSEQPDWMEGNRAE